jgi:fumarylacetoacetase
VFSTPDRSPRIGVRIGDLILDLSVSEAAGLLPTREIFCQPNLNRFMAAGSRVWKEVRWTLQDLLKEENARLRDDRGLRTEAFLSCNEVTMHLPAEIRGYTDFYSSKHHASNVGAMFRDKENPLLPNWTHVPVAYHGRVSSLIPADVPVCRPHGQVKYLNEPGPRFEPSRQLDFELEVGYLIGRGNPLGQPIPIAEARDHVFGLVLVNDWSARDIQRWEYVPLGPFLSKNLATSVSPWVVTLEALEPFRTSAPAQEPEPLPYLRRVSDSAYNLALEVHLLTSALREPVCICRTNFKEMYWDLGQQIAHHTINGCNLEVGDLLASGTISGPEPDSWGSLLELTFGGKSPLQLPNGEERTFLDDGDAVIMTGYAQGDGYRVGFGDLRSAILPALPL